MSTIAAPPRKPSSRLMPFLPIAVLSVAFGAVSGTVVDAAVPFAVTALVWAAAAGAVAPWAARKGGQSSVWATAPVFIACPLALMVLGGALLGQLMSGSPQSALALFQQPSYGNFFFAFHVLFEWVLMPAMLMFNWHDRSRRKLLLVAAAVFYLGRISSALYFAPHAMDWADIPSGASLSSGLLDDVQLWMNLNVIRLILQDALSAALVFVVALRPHRGDPAPALTHSASGS